MTAGPGSCLMLHVRGAVLLSSRATLFVGAVLPHGAAGAACRGARACGRCYGAAGAVPAEAKVSYTGVVRSSAWRTQRGAWPRPGVLKQRLQRAVLLLEALLGRPSREAGHLPHSSARGDRGGPEACRCEESLRSL